MNGAARLVDLLGSFPTVAFTGLLVFCLAGWLVSLAVSGLEGDADVDVDLSSGTGGRGATGLGRGGTPARGFSAGPTAAPGAHSGPGGYGRPGGRGRAGRRSTGGGPLARLSRAVGLGHVPLTLGLTVGSFGAWATSLLASLVTEDWSSGPRTAAGLVVTAGALLVGAVSMNRFARVAQPLFVTELAPGRSDAVGRLCRVRSVEVSERMGQAEVLSGRLRGAVVSIRPAESELSLSRGDTALIIGFDEQRQVYLAAQADESLLDEP